MELANFYVHARFPEVSRSEFEAMATRLEERVVVLGRSFARRHEARESELIYYFDEGSLVGRAKIIGGLALGVYVAISQYPEFRKGVTELYEDARAFGTAAVQEFRHVTGVREQDILYQRRISRDVNRLHRIVENVDLIASGLVPESDAMRYRDAIVSDIAGLQKSHPTDVSIERLLEVVPGRQLPPMPKNIHDLRG
jgi:hypothetical protein